MVESIYTIPLTEALDEDCACPFCYLEEKLEKEQVDYALGAAMMEPDFRILSNEKGYCRHHIEKMSKMRRALPLALVLDTRTDELLAAFKSTDFSKKGGLFKKDKSVYQEFFKKIEGLTTSCLICERVEKTMAKFMNTFWYLYGKETEFKDKFLSGRGVCIPHFVKLAEALSAVSSSKRDGYLKELAELELKALEHEKEEVHTFVKQFDYRSDKSDLKCQKDAHLNCAARLSGKFDRE